MLNIRPMIALLIAGIVVAAPAAAETPEVPNKPVFKMETAHCAVEARVEPRGRARVYVTHKSSQKSCALTEKETSDLVFAVLGAQSVLKDQGDVRTLMLGKLHDFGWMQQHLIRTAESDPNWSQKDRRPKTGHANRYVNKVLSMPKVKLVLDQAASRFGLGYSGADCEKIFITKDGLPESGTCWILFARR